MEIAVVEARGADIDADLFAGEARRRDAGVLERFPDDLEQQALLRIDLRGLAWRDAEHARIKGEGFGEITAAERVAEAGFLQARVLEPLGPPAAFGQRTDRATAFAEKAPEFILIGGAREAAGCAEDGDRVLIFRGSAER